MSLRLIFVDESGDPVPVRPGERNWYFACIALEVPAKNLALLVDCFVEARYHRLHSSELRSLANDRRYRARLVELFALLAGTPHVNVSLTWLDKRRYTGPYLQDDGATVRFRNFQLRRLLEWHFALHPPSGQPRYELIVDRYLHSSSQLDNLRKYLSNNWSLPPFEAVTFVDSRYVELIQAADLLLHLWRGANIPNEPDEAQELRRLDLSFVRACDVSAMTKDWRPPIQGFGRC